MSDTANNNPPSYTLNIRIPPKIIILSRNVDNNESSINPPLYVKNSGNTYDKHDSGTFSDLVRLLTGEDYTIQHVAVSNGKFSEIIWKLVK